VGDPSWVLQSIQPSALPSNSEPTVSITQTIDLTGDSIVGIEDFSLFVEYYKVGNVKIDFDEDGKTQRDIEDLNYFIQEYKKEKPDRNE
jgi:hypothetical protein